MNPQLGQRILHLRATITHPQISQLDSFWAVGSSIEFPLGRVAARQTDTRLSPIPPGGQAASVSPFPAQKSPLAGAGAAGLAADRLGVSWHPLGFPDACMGVFRRRLA